MLLRGLTLILAATLLAGSAFAQTPTVPATPGAAGEKPGEKPQVKVNYLNVCAPTAADQQVLENVLGRISPKPTFAIDMEVSRGRSTLNPSDLVINTGQPTQQTDSISRWVRIRRDFPDAAPMTGAQYSFSVSGKHVSETLVFHFRDTKDVLQLSINDSVDAVEDAASVARVQTPADRIRIERFGKPSIVLARCPNADQTAVEPIFGHATSLLNAYRRAFDIRGTVPPELGRLSPTASKAPKKSDQAAPGPR